MYHIVLIQAFSSAQNRGIPHNFVYIFCIFGKMFYFSPKFTKRYIFTCQIPNACILCSICINKEIHVMRLGNKYIFLYFALHIAMSHMCTVL